MRNAACKASRRSSTQGERTRQGGGSARWISGPRWHGDHLIGSSSESPQTFWRGDRGNEIGCVFLPCVSGPVAVGAGSPRAALPGTPYRRCCSGLPCGGSRWRTRCVQSRRATRDRRQRSRDTTRRTGGRGVPESQARRTLCRVASSRGARFAVPISTLPCGCRQWTADATGISSSGTRHGQRRKHLTRS